MPLIWKPLKDRVQTELIKRGHCVGCGRSLADADRRPYSQESREATAAVGHRMVLEFQRNFEIPNRQVYFLISAIFFTVNQRLQSLFIFFNM